MAISRLDTMANSLIQPIAYCTAKGASCQAAFGNILYQNSLQRQSFNHFVAVASDVNEFSHLAEAVDVDEGDHRVPVAESTGVGDHELVAVPADVGAEHRAGDGGKASNEGLIHVELR